MFIKTYDSLEYTVAQMIPQTIVIVLFFVLLLTYNIISLRRSALKKQMWDYSYTNKNKTQINIAFLFTTDVLDIQYYCFKVILLHTLCCSLPRALNK